MGYMKDPLSRGRSRSRSVERLRKSRSRSPARGEPQSHNRHSVSRSHSRSPIRRSRYSRYSRSRSGSRSPAPRRRGHNSRSRSRSRSRERRTTGRQRERPKDKEGRLRKHGRSRSHSVSSESTSSIHKHHKQKSKKRRRSSRSRERKERKKEKKAKKKAAEKSHWGKYGIITETDIFTKGAEFHTWLVEERKINPETLSKEQSRKEFARFVEDYNTATLPHEKYYSMEAYDRRMSALRSGEFVPPPEDTYDPNADLMELKGAHKKKNADPESYLTREQLIELRKVQNERVQAGKMKLLGMEVKQNMGVRMDEAVLDDF